MHLEAWNLSHTYTATAAWPLRDRNSLRLQRLQRSRNYVLQLVGDWSGTGCILIGDLMGPLCDLMQLVTDWLPTGRLSIQRITKIVIFFKMFLNIGYHDRIYIFSIFYLLLIICKWTINWNKEYTIITNEIGRSLQRLCTTKISQGNLKENEKPLYKTMFLSQWYFSSSCEFLSSYKWSFVYTKLCYVNQCKILNNWWSVSATLPPVPWWTIMNSWKWKVRPGDKGSQFLLVGYQNLPSLHEITQTGSMWYWNNYFPRGSLSSEDVC